MKPIKSISIWKNGSIQNGTFLNINIFRDNLKDSAIFGYQISADTTEVLADGELTISGTDYEAWTDNDYAWNYVAGKLGVEFI